MQGKSVFLQCIFQGVMDQALWGLNFHDFTAFPLVWDPDCGVHAMQNGPNIRPTAQFYKSQSTFIVKRVGVYTNKQMHDIWTLSTRLSLRKHHVWD